jgi:superfamily II DNA or RNA helicase
MANDWRGLADAYPGVPCVGLTATLQRADGEPLGDIFDVLVVAASYSELVRDGFLVPATVLRPERSLGDDLAQDPVDAWIAHSGNAQTFMFAARVAIALDWERRLRDLGIRAATIHATTPAADRRESLAAFRAGAVRVLCNVGTLTEGVDVPEASCVVLARGFGHVGQYLQVVGRVLRTAPGKSAALVIDLTGTSHRHGLPNDDRVYSLGERPISGGEAFGGGGGAAPAFTQEVKGLRLQAVGALPPAQPVTVVPRDESKMRAEYQRLVQVARQHRMRDGFAAAKFKEQFGEWPRQEWA